MQTCYKSWDDIEELRRSDQNDKYIKFLKWFEETRPDESGSNMTEDEVDCSFGTVSLEEAREQIKRFSSGKSERQI